MKRMRSRLVSMLLIITTLTTMLPAKVFAAELEDKAFANIVTESDPIEALSIASQPDFSFATISGKVVDSQGTGIPGVSVMLYNVDENTTLSQCVTNATGLWVSADYDAIVGYTYIIRYYKSGYMIVPNNIQVTVPRGSTTVETATATPLDIDDLVCNADDYSYTIDTEKATITKYTGTDTAIQLPSELGGYPVVAIDSNAFKDNTTLQTVCLSENITSIGTYAFRGCVALSSVYLPNGLVSVGDRAFQNCTALADLNFPNGLKTIGSYAFCGCTGFTSIELPDSVETIYGNAFMNCTNLSSINYPANWKTASSEIFAGCQKLTSIIVPEGVTVIPSYAFYGANYLKSVTLPSTLTSIGSHAFRDCSVLDTINLPNGLVSIGDRAFQNCTALADLNFPNGLKTIGSYAFCGCTGFTSIELPDSVENIYGDAFMNCTNLSSINYPASWKTASSEIFAGCQKLTSIIVPEGVTVIPSYAFYGANYLKSVTLPSTLTSIGSHAFRDCTALLQIVIPDGVSKIPTYAFSGCVDLEHIWLGDAVVTIESKAFHSCSALTIHGIAGSYAEEYAIANSIPFSKEALNFDSVCISGRVTDAKGNGMGAVTVSVYNVTRNEFVEQNYKTDANGVWSIDYATQGNIYTYLIRYYKAGYIFDKNNIEATAVSGEVSIETVTATPLDIDDLVCNADDYSYTIDTEKATITKYTGTDTAIQLPSELGGYPVAAIGSNAFKDNTTLQTVCLSENITSIGTYAFRGCVALRSVYLPNGLVSVGDRAFQNCTALADLNFPNGLKTIGSYAFCGCTGFTSIELPDSVETIYGNAFMNCTNLSSINYPASWKTASSEIFAGCQKLTSIIVPEGVTVIPSYAFYGANYLKSVTLPSTLTTIGNNAFYNCTQLRCAILPTSVTSIGNYAFSNCSQLRYVMASGESYIIGNDTFKNSPKMLLYSNMSSMATVHAIKSSIPFIATETTVTSATGVFDRSATNYFADTSGASTNNYVTLTAQFCVLEDVWTNSSTRKIEIHVPDGTALIESTLKLNGNLCQDFTLDGQTILIPVTQRENTVKFSVRILAQSDLTSYALFSYYKDRKTNQAVIGIINESMESFTLSAEELTSEQQIRIEGVAPASAAISVFVDGSQVTTLTASKAGNYAGSIALTSDVEEKTYVVSASCAGSDGNLLFASQTVTYEKSAPVLTGFTFYINNGSQVVDLYSMAQQGIRPSITHTGSRYPYKFVINFKNPESINRLYVTSTRSNVKKSIDAVYDDSLGAFVAIGHFDEANPLYVPGNLGVEYTLKHEEALVGQEVDWTNLQNRISKELRENTTVTSETNAGTTTGTIDFSKVEESLVNTALNYTIKAFDESAGTSIKDLLDLAETETNIFSYIVPGLDDSRYVVLLDFRDPTTYTMIVGDALSVAETAVEFTLSMTEFSNPSYVNLFDLSSKLSNYSTAVGVVSKTFGIINDCNSLRDEIMQSSSINEEDTSAALRKVDELESDRMAFLLLTTALPLIVGSGGAMAGPTLLFGAMIGVMVSMSDIFWQLRVSEIKGEDYKIKWHIDPSGYVYDVDTGLRIPDVTTTVYCIEYDDSEEFWGTPPLNTDYGTMWNASEHNQSNPLITDANGCYAWDVPEGWWRVKYEKDGYATVWSD